MIMMQISESKKNKLSEYTEKLLHYAGKMMQCVESLDSDEGYGERSYGHYGARDYGRYGSRMGMREEIPEEYGERLDTYGDRRNRMGRYY